MKDLSSSIYYIDTLADLCLRILNTHTISFSFFDVATRTENIQYYLLFITSHQAHTENGSVRKERAPSKLLTLGGNSFP